MTPEKDAAKLQVEPNLDYQRAVIESVFDLCADSLIPQNNVDTGDHFSNLDRGRSANNPANRTTRLRPRPPVAMLEGVLDIRQTAFPAPSHGTEPPASSPKQT